MSSETVEGYAVNGHDFEVVNTIGDSTLVECTECLMREVISDDKDSEDYLDLMTPRCHIEWLRHPDDEGFHGVALRNAGRSWRHLISVRKGGDTGNGEVANAVRVYDDDAPLLATLLDRREWSRRERRGRDDSE